jgi:hypothetical protein
LVGIALFLAAIHIDSSAERAQQNANGPCRKIEIYVQQSSSLVIVPQWMQSTVSVISCQLRSSVIAFTKYSQFRLLKEMLPESATIALDRRRMMLLQTKLKR